MNKIFLWSFLFCNISFAATPLFTLRPNITAQSTLINGEMGSAVYQVTNNTHYSFPKMALVMPNGITPNVNSVSSNSQYCGNPFELGPGASCLLKINLVSNLLGNGVNNGPTICTSASQPVYCAQPFTPDQLHTTISQGPVPQDCAANVANFNYELLQNFDSASGFVAGWGPERNPLDMSPQDPDLTQCSSSAGVTWMRQRIQAAAAFWISQKLNYCHHYNPDWATPPSGRNASETQAGYCNPSIDTMPGTPYYGQKARWNYTGLGSETADNWVNNNQMWYGMDCSNTTAFLYNFAFGPSASLGIPFDSKTNFQAGQSNGQDQLSPNTQVPGDVTKILNNPQKAGLLVCADGTLDPTPATPSMCTGRGGYLSGINSSGVFTKSITPSQVASVLQPGDLLFIAGAGPDPHPNPDGSTSDVTHVIMWIGKQVGTGPNDINPKLIAPNDAPCANPTIWLPKTGDWVIADSHFQGYDYRVLTSCFYLNDLWGVRRVIR